MAITKPNHAFALTTEQLEHFRREGYVKIEQVIPADLLKDLQDFTSGLPQLPHPQPDFAYGTGENSNLISGMLKICRLGNLSALRLLGSAALLERAASVCGPDLFPVQDFAVIKNQHDGSEVLWHRDVHNQIIGNTCMIGVYLDRADAGDGAIRVVPGSHRSDKDICELQKEPFDEVPMLPGDILMHDLMLVHSSTALHNYKQRRVLYFEFMPAAETIAQKIYDAPVVKNRIRLLSLAMAFAAKHGAPPPSFAWAHAHTFAHHNETDFVAELEEIYATPFSVKSSNYCMENIQSQTA